MGIYVKGIEMPQICEVCPLVDRFVTVDFKTITCKVTKKLRPDSCLTRPDSCPLIEVPPHGRLIDADALINEFKILQSGREIFGMELDSSFLSSGQELSTEWYCVEDAIEDAPTIIEAEEW